MKVSIKYIQPFLVLLIFWVIIFDFQRILFLIIQVNKFSEASWFDIGGVFFQSLRLDLATASFLSAIPMLFLLFWSYVKTNTAKFIYIMSIILELIIVSLIHSGEINVYHEWNHKLTSRVFMHLSNPNEIFRTAELGSQLLFFVILIIEIVVGYFLLRKTLLKPLELEKKWILLPLGLIYISLFFVLVIINKAELGS